MPLTMSQTCGSAKGSSTVNGYVYNVIDVEAS